MDFNKNQWQKDFKSFIRSDALTQSDREYSTPTSKYLKPLASCVGCQRAAASAPLYLAYLLLFSSIKLQTKSPRTTINVAPGPQNTPCTSPPLRQSDAPHKASMQLRLSPTPFDSIMIQHKILPTHSNAKPATLVTCSATSVPSKLAL